MRELGTSDPSTSSYSDVIRITEWNKPHILKFLDGPVRVYSVFYPYIDDTGKYKTGMFTCEDWKTNPLSSFAKIDCELQKEEILKRFNGNTEAAQKEIGEIRSSFNPNASNHYLGIDKSDPVPLVRRIQVSNTVRTELIRLESEHLMDSRGNVDQTKLAYGKLFMLWFDVRKVKKDSAKGEAMWNTQYTVKVVEDLCAKFKGMFPSYILSSRVSVDEAKKSIVLKSIGDVIEIPLAKLVDSGMFTEDEFNAMLTFEHGIRELTKPMSNDEIMEKLNQNPIALNGKDKNGEFLYPSWEKIAQKAMDMKLALPFTTKTLELTEAKDTSFEFGANTGANTKEPNTAFDDFLNKKPVQEWSAPV